MHSLWLYFKHLETARKYLKPVGVIIAIVILVILLNDSSNYNKIVKKSELTRITGTLSNQPSIEVASEGGPWVPIKLKEFSNFRFNIGGTKYSALKAKKFVLDARIGDTITLDILKHDLDAKIIGIQKPRFSERLINYKFIEPYSIKVHDEIYMSLEDVNEQWATNNALGRFLVFWFGGIFLIVGIIYLILSLTGIIKKIESWFPNT